MWSVGRASLIGQSKSLHVFKVQWKALGGFGAGVCHDQESVFFKLFWGLSLLCMTPTLISKEQELAYLACGLALSLTKSDLEVSSLLFVHREHHDLPRGIVQGLKEISCVYTHTHTYTSQAQGRLSKGSF